MLVWTLYLTLRAHKTKCKMFVHQFTLDKGLCFDLGTWSSLLIVYIALAVCGEVCSLLTMHGNSVDMKHEDALLN